MPDAIRMMTAPYTFGELIGVSGVRRWREGTRDIASFLLDFSRFAWAWVVQARKLPTGPIRPFRRGPGGPMGWSDPVVTRLVAFQGQMGPR